MSAEADATTTRATTAADATAVAAFLAGVQPDNPKADEATLRWQYWDNPYGQACAWVAEDGGRIVGHYAAYPVPGRIAGRDVAASWGADAATAESHRGRGLFTTLAASVYADCGRHGMVATLCNPNPASLKGALRAGMVDVARIPLHVLPLDPAWVAERFHLPRAAAKAARAAIFRGRSAAAATATVVADVPDEVTALWARVGGRVDSGVVRDAGWWRFRYATRPAHGYRFAAAHRAGRLVAAVAVTTREVTQRGTSRPAGGSRLGEVLDAPFVHVLDLLAEEPADAAAVLAAACEDRGLAVGAAAIAPPATDAAEHLRAAGFRRLPERLEPRPIHFGVVPNAPDLPPMDSLTWTFPWGLFDHL